MLSDTLSRSAVLAARYPSGAHAPGGASLLLEIIIYMHNLHDKLPTVNEKTENE
jgi:hypothetical protein